MTDKALRISVKKENPDNSSVLSLEGERAEIFQTLHYIERLEMCHILSYPLYLKKENRPQLVWQVYLYQAKSQSEVDSDQI